MLAQTATRVAERNAFSRELALADVQSALAVLVEAVEQVVSGGTARDLSEYSWTPMARPMLAALRRDLLAHNVGKNENPVALIAVLAAIDVVESSLENEMAARLSQQLGGANSLPLLVEVVHDMRSPLTAILFLIERLQQGQSGPVSLAQQRHLALVYSAAFGLNSLTTDLMELAHGGKRLLDEPPKKFSIGEMLRSVRNLVQPLAEERKLSVRFSGPPVDRRWGQPAALSRVLLNLTTNAFKFTTVGSVTVLVEQLSNGDELSFTVQDTGAGLSDTEIANLFSVFSNANPGRPNQFSSSGLGLAICYKLVAAMGGTLRVESSNHSGTRVHFTLSMPAA